MVLGAVIGTCIVAEETPVFDTVGRGVGPFLEAGVPVTFGVIALTGMASRARAIRFLGVL